MPKAGGAFHGRSGSPGDFSRPGNPWTHERIRQRNTDKANAKPDDDAGGAEGEQSNGGDVTHQRAALIFGASRFCSFAVSATTARISSSSLSLILPSASLGGGAYLPSSSLCMLSVIALRHLSNSSLRRCNTWICALY